MKSKKNHNTSEEKLNKKDDAGRHSLMMRQIFVLRKNYLMRRMAWYLAAAIAFEVALGIILSVATTLSSMAINMILTVVVILIGISIFTLTSQVRIRDSKKMEDYVRARFDKDQGVGAYDKTIKDAARQQ